MNLTVYGRRTQVTTHNPKVLGSNPSPATDKKHRIRAGVFSLTEKGSMKKRLALFCMLARACDQRIITISG